MRAVGGMPAVSAQRTCGWTGLRTCRQHAQQFRGGSRNGRRSCGNLGRSCSRAGLRGRSRGTFRGGTRLRSRGRSGSRSRLRLRPRTGLLRTGGRLLSLGGRCRLRARGGFRIMRSAAACNAQMRQGRSRSGLILGSRSRTLRRYGRFRGGQNRLRADQSQSAGGGC